MDLRAKLALLRSMEPPAALFEPPPEPVRPAYEPGEDPIASAKAERIAQLRALIGEVSARDKRRAPAPAAPQPEVPMWPCIETEHGTLHVHERYLEPDHHHGRVPLRAGLAGQASTVMALLRESVEPDIDLSRALYLDTETTGLAGGTGTVAFLVGLARFVDGALCTEQLIVRQLGAEAPVLARLAERIAAASCVITYNGKSFDWPLLRTRFVLARLPVPALPPHLDLLHVCRSLWKARLPSLRLVDMEREILCFERQDDLPGSEIPARYFEFLRTGSPAQLAAVLEHNQNDLIALSALLGAVMGCFEHTRPLADPCDAISFGRLALRAGDAERAARFAAWAIEHSVSRVDRRRALILASDIDRHQGRFSEALARLEDALLHTDDAHLRSRLHFKLAKHYEHEQRDLARALRHARNTELIEGPVLHGRRLGRLHRRILRQHALHAVSEVMSPTPKDSMSPP